MDGFIADREGAFGFTVPTDDLFRFHNEQTRELGGFLLGRRLYETMLAWDTDPSLRDTESAVAFAEVDELTRTDSPIATDDAGR